MNRFLLVALLAIALLNNAVALRGALFRSGRSLLQRQNLEGAAQLNQAHFVPMDKRTPIVELYPVVDSESDSSFPSYFRL